MTEHTVHRPIPFCVNCLHYFLRHELQTPYEVRCDNPKNVISFLNPVDGQQITNQVAVTAANCRANSTLCGYEGKWFEPKVAPEPIPAVIDDR